MVAGVKRVVLATPPRAWAGSPELRWAARELGLREVLLAGGAHGIAGLVSFLGCTKIVGPGNRWVAAAKQLVSSVVSIDLFAGPSEVLVVASSDAEPELVAADLLAQAEHDSRASCLLFTDSVRLAKRVDAELERQIVDLPTAGTAQASLGALGLAVVFPSLGTAAAAARTVASEHVQLLGRKAERYREPLSETAGALFSGSATPTAFGDYLAGPNHVLPTGGAGRSFSGLSTRDFYRWGRSVSFSAYAARKLAGSAAILARFEGLIGHARSLERRGR
jgi:histidinol dehydrogenase